ncbi:MAG: hypothetical protein ACM3ME_07255, partial [Chloroflexota bacterium]
MSHFAYKYHHFSPLTGIFGLVVMIILMLSSSVYAQNDTLLQRRTDTIAPGVVNLNDSINIHLGDTIKENDSLTKKGEPKKSA